MSFFIPSKERIDLLVIVLIPIRYSFFLVTTNFGELQDIEKFKGHFLKISKIDKKKF